MRLQICSYLDHRSMVMKFSFLDQGFYSSHFRRVAKSVARIIALALDLDVDFFDRPEMLAKPIAILRLLHYEGGQKTGHAFMSNGICPQGT